ncbi:hypothetical protein BBP40_011326 [Aspergillus hancockii]|nr:hypothetical protein BBP40_011326 [Aspergillus hancockii]
MSTSAPIDGGYGWVIVFAVFWTNVHHWGILSSYGVFLEYFTSHSKFPSSGLPASQTLVLLPMVSKIHRRYGLRATIALGMVFETVALLGAS